MRPAALILLDPLCQFACCATPTPCLRLCLRSSAIKWESIFEFTAPPGHGDVTGVVVRDVSIRASNRGIGFQQRTGPGAYSNVTIERVDIEARGVTGNTWWGAGEAIWVTVVPERSGLPYALGGIHGVVFRNVTTMSEQVPTWG